MAAIKKRALEDASVNPKSKKTKTDNMAPKGKGKTDTSATTSSRINAEEVDFPRGGGTSFTPLEVKAIRAEAAQEAKDELFDDKAEKRKKRKSAVPTSGKKAAKGEKGDTVRVEHLNYKRVAVGMKVLGQIVSIQPLALIISLPNQLFAHVPVTEISSQLTAMLEAMDEDDALSSSDDDEEAKGISKPRVPDLFQVFRVGQYVRAVVSAVHSPGTTDPTGLSRARDEIQKASRRVELSLVPSKVNEGVSKTDLRAGFTLTAAIKSKEDHGYILDLGVSDGSGFLSFKDASKGPFDEPEDLHIGRLLDVTVTKMSGNGRTCNVTANPATYNTVFLTEVTSKTSVLPGTLVQALVTAVVPDGLNLQVLGYFGGTVDQFHLAPGDPEQHYKVGQKVKARVLYDISGSSPPRFALSLAKHLVQLAPKMVASSGLPDSYPIGTTLDAVKVIRAETERGLVVEVSDGVNGYVHISQVSDDHVPSLSSSSGHWKIGTVHKARVTGYFALDGCLQLSFRQSVLQQKFLQVGEVQVGELIKGTVKKLTESALFVSISGTVDGVIWPNHYADITLKHPQKRFKPGGSIKCRVLVVDPERSRIVLTAKKTLLDSPLPIVSRIEDAKEGLITHAVVFKVSDKSVQVEFYNNLKAVVPAREASETAVRSLSEAFAVGKPVKVKLLSVDHETSRIFASIRQAASNFKATITDISGVEIGDSVEGVIAEIQKDKVAVTLQPTQVRALLSLNNLANKRGVSAAQLRTSLKVEEKLQDLVVVSRNPEKGIVLVATKPKEKEVLTQKSSLSLDTIQVGQLVGGRVLRHGRQGALVKLTNTISGTLHPTDVSDDFGSGNPFPPVDSILKAVVLAVDKEKRQLTLSTRPSRMHSDEDKAVLDKEVKDLGDLKVGDSVRGFVKNVAEHGLFVMLGRNVDARVQIKELFDQYVKDWKSHFSANQLVKGRILSIDREKRQRDMRSGVTLADLTEGQKLDGRVKKVEDYGIFIEIEGSKVSGLCHKSELSDNKDADVTLALRSFREGDHVKAVILSIDLDKRRISFGLKPSYFADDDFEMSKGEDSDEEEGADETLGVVEDAGMDESDAQEVDHQASDEDSSDNESQVDFDEGALEVNMNINSDEQQRGSQAKPSTSSSMSLSLDLKHGFQWSANQDHDADVGMSSSDEEEEDSQERKKKKRKRKEIEQDLTADMQTRTPESNADFERVLLGSPNSSYLWIQYMSFQLQISEVDKAREIAKRALRTINFREEQEKLNVWIALLNLENIYGTDESLEVTFKDAARHNDSKTIHLRLAIIFDQSGKPEKAEEQYKRTCKKFSQSSKVWTLFGEHYLKRGKLEDARKLLPRSLQSLEKRKHLKTISKFAQLEYKFGDPERGKTVFEGIVDSHPKRWDLWSIYIDMEAGQGEIMTVRNIFDRVLTLKMTSHKAKTFFKKWLELERRLGDEEGASAVKAKAIEWTQRAAGSS
ncbi:U3 snoRNP-associated protein Rrp5 [Fomitopsis serialis]|uniref:U3 snoRNP-associated protein Rrp5 n=1 Tax=Fomitopsis serialis TaxID=139415 RepID=UPI0020074B90|nr:U3 snoRNP-associated protein Rrp5 [Neoantrodia serialis]KAH9937237.1 U3 snoRNP-associated protein Rrp5 [Neoantrodia serialis]